jgi:hypothetical protein
MPPAAVRLDAYWTRERRPSAGHRVDRRLETRLMKVTTHLELDRLTGIVDVHVLDVLAQVESLLRDARKIQRWILRVRGVPQPAMGTQRRAAAAEIRKLARRMSSDATELPKILKGLEQATDTLTQAAKAS